MDEIYENVTFHELKQQQETDPPNASSREDPRRLFRRGIVTSLVLLCLLLLAGITVMAWKTIAENLDWNRRLAQFNKRSSNLTEEVDNLQASIRNLTEEVDALKASNCNLTKEVDTLQASIRNLTQERDMLQERFETVIDERNHCQREEMKKEWKLFRGSYYKVSSEQKTWQESRLDCQKRGGDLVIISSEQEQDFIRGFNMVLWIGLTDAEEEGTWKWVDGTEPAARYWNSGEPNGSPSNEEDCGEIMLYKKLNSWNDAPCESKKHWVCEKTA